MSLHSSLGKESKTPSQKKPKKKQQVDIYWALTSLIETFQQSLEVGFLMGPILYIRKLRHREIKNLLQRSKQGSGWAGIQPQVVWRERKTQRKMPEMKGGAHFLMELKMNWGEEARSSQVVACPQCHRVVQMAGAGCLELILWCIIYRCYDVISDRDLLQTLIPWKSILKRHL